MKTKQLISGLSIIELATKKRTTYKADFYVRGKRIRKSFKSKEECTEFYRKYDTSLTNNLQEKTFKGVVEEFFAVHEVKPSTKVGYKVYSRRYLKQWGHLLFNDITLLMIKRMRNDFKELGLSESSIRNHERFLRSLYTFAVSHDFAPKHLLRLEPTYTDKTKEKATKEKIIKYFTREEVKQILNQLDKDFESDYAKREGTHLIEAIRCFVYIATFTGMRKGEISALKWTDIDFDKEEISVRRTAYEIGKDVHITPPKSDNSNRELFTSPVLMNAITRYKKFMLEFRLANRFESEWLFPNLSTNLPVYRLWSNRFKSVCERADIDTKGLHALRHTHATELLYANVDWKTLSNRLGHSNITFTLNTYAHILEDKNKDIMSKFFESYDKDMLNLDITS